MDEVGTERRQRLRTDGGLVAGGTWDHRIYLPETFYLS
jgi:hypothetical protein